MYYVLFVTYRPLCADRLKNYQPTPAIGTITDALVSSYAPVIFVEVTMHTASRVYLTI